MLRLLSLAIPLLVFIHGCETLPQTTSTFASQWSDHPAIERPWAGGEYWLNPLQAWMQKHGKLQCEVSGGDRNAVLLTHTVSSMDNFTMKVNIENLQPENRSDTSGWVGFQIGLKGAFNDYRDDAVHGRGLCLGLTNNGKLFIGDHHQSIQLDSYGSISFHRQLTGSVASDSNYHLSLQYLDSETHIADTFGLAVHHSWIQGLVALACSQTMPTPVSYNEPRPHFRDIPELGKQAGGNTRYAFSGWMVEGGAVA